MKLFGTGHRCENCGQEIGFLVPEAAAAGYAFQNGTYLQLTAFDIRSKRQTLDFWYCSEYCAREHLDERLNTVISIKKRASG